ncbi:MAG: GNAT family N-acetyltransferase [Candidatus Competibacteraceae bacterium]|nr:GNAT family N-acetyltransferase [Candidatus Competibacteraceae bacterium]
MQTVVLESLEEVPAHQWNALVVDDYPFLRHEFLVALERHDCVGKLTGWLPRHLVCRDGRGRLLGAAPFYLKSNSYGEFVFDWSWADAYHRHGLAYFPKLVCAVPYTPAAGQRLLLTPGPEGEAVARALIRRALALARELDCSSLHWLFTTEQETDWLCQEGLMLRLGCQFHWYNPGYRDFEDFLSTLTNKKRKNIRQERRRVREGGLELQVREGPEITPEQWSTFHTFYCDTFHRRGGYPTLTLPFFREIGHTLGRQVVLVVARYHGRMVAAALSFRSRTTLYGRHWGCLADFDALHFEACYYQGLDYCIRQGLSRFEPGAQGEHKISRGFLPTLTHSAHWMAHPAFQQAVEDFLGRERPAVKAYARELKERSPYRQTQES